MTDDARNPLERGCIARRETADVANPGRVLVAYAGRSKHTKAIAVALVDRLSHDGLTAELADLDAGAVPPAADYEAVVIGSCVQFGRNPQSVIDYIVHSREAFAAMPTYLFSIGNGDLAGIVRVTGWEPTGSVMFDPLRPDRRRFLKRLGGHVPSSTEVALAESDRVRSFAGMIGQAVSTAGTMAADNRDAGEQQRERRAQLLPG